MAAQGEGDAVSGGLRTLDAPGRGETPRGHMPQAARQVEALLVSAAGAPLRRLWYRLNCATLTVDERSIALPRWPAHLPALRVLHLSDLHLTAEMRPEWWLRRLAGLRVDVVAITGDLIQDDSGTEACHRFLRELRPLARLGVFTTLGNHDYLDYTIARLPDGRVVQQRSPNDLPALIAAIRAAGVTLLDNEARPLSGPVWLVGVGDPYTGHDDMDHALAGLPAEAVTVMLAHSPDQLPDAAARGVDLLLGGHTHGGQIVLPLVGPLRTATLGRLRLASGYAEYRGTRCHISRGLGTAGLPVRLLCPPQATVLVVGGPGMP